MLCSNAPLQHFMAHSHVSTISDLGWFLHILYTLQRYLIGPRNALRRSPLWPHRQKACCTKMKLFDRVSRGYHLTCVATNCGEGGSGVNISLYLYWHSHFYLDLEVSMLLIKLSSRDQWIFTTNKLFCFNC